MPIAQLCRQSLQKNKLTTLTGTAMPAGFNQFGSLWTRDFCHAVPGLLAAGELATVTHQLEQTLKYQRSDGLLPRCLDVTSPKLRVMAALFYPPSLTTKKFLYSENQLRPEYLGEHLTPAFDSNVLVAIAIEKIRSSSPEFYEKSQPALVKALDYYRDTLINGLFHQPQYSDWLDSLKRDGPQLYFHILLLKYLQSTGKNISWLPDNFAKLIFEHFLAGEKWKRESTESLLWIVADPSLCGELPAEKVWSHLRDRGWGVPLPAQHWREVSWTNKFVGLRHYHDSFRWSWLLGESLKIARRLKRPEENEIVDLITKLVEESGAVSEIYDSRTGREVKTWIYKSEKPFTWGAAKILEALQS